MELLFKQNHSKLFEKKNWNEYRRENEWSDCNSQRASPVSPVPTWRIHCLAQLFLVIQTVKTYKSLSIVSQVTLYDGLVDWVLESGVHMRNAKIASPIALRLGFETWTFVSERWWVMMEKKWIAAIAVWE